MAGPDTPLVQPEIWDSLDSGYPWIICGSLGDAIYVVATVGSDITFALYQGENPPVLLSSTSAFSDHILWLTAENGAGDVAAVVKDATTGACRVVHITRSGTTISISSFSIDYEPVQLFVSGDGAEILTVQDTTLSKTITGYSLSGSLHWSTVLPNDGYSHSGYVAGSPSAGRFVWVNTSDATYQFIVSAGYGSTEITHGIDGYSTTDVTFALPDLTGLTVQSVVMSVTATWGGTIGSSPNTGGYVEFNGQGFPQDLAYEWYHGVPLYVNANDYIPGPTSSGTIVIHNSNIDQPWLYYSANQFINIDNSAAGGGTIELRSSTGAVLASVSGTDPLRRGNGRWITNGPGRVAYVICEDGGTST